MKARADASMTDEELMAAFYCGSDTAFDLLHSRHQAKLCAWLAMRTYFGWTRAEDLTQQAFINIFNTRYSVKARFKPGGASFRTWAYKISYNLLYAEHRSDERESSMADGDIDYLQTRRSTLSSSSDQGPLEHVLRSAVGNALLECLQGLTEPARTVFELLALDLAATEIAGIIGKNDVDVSRIRKRAIPALRGCLDIKGVRSTAKS